MELTVLEKFVLRHLLFSITSGVNYDKEYKEYTLDNTSVFSCSLEEYLILKKILNELEN